MQSLTMVDALNIDGGKVFLNGEEIFSIPLDDHTVETVGFWEARENTMIYVGSRSCCHGHLYTLCRNSVGQYRLHDILTLDMNLTDILPVVIDYKKAGLPRSEGFIVTGSGCDGAGVRLVDPSFAKLLAVVAEDEHRSKGEYGRPSPCSVFRIDKSNNTIHLDFRRTGWQVKAGMRRDPALPSACADPNTQEFCVSFDLSGTIDLTSRLEEAGVDISSTMERITSYRRVLKY